VRDIVKQLLRALSEAPATLPRGSTYTIANGFMYVGSGLLLLIWPAAVQRLFLDAAFVGHEADLFRIIGLTLAIIGWLYIYGGRSGGRQIVAATVIDRVVFVPLVLVPLVVDGVFPHILATFAILDPALATGAWFILSREPR
jgi:uncharacterized protein YjeT (DUF2065 family)